MKLPGSKEFPHRNPIRKWFAPKQRPFVRSTNFWQMSPVLRQAFTMAYYHEPSIEEAGALLGVSAGTFKSRVFRARQYLVVQQTQRSLVAPIRCVTRTLSSPRGNPFAPSAATSAEIPSPEVAFG